MMKRYPDMSIEISGHTDNVGTMAYNQRLSESRALVVKDYLVRNGIAAKRIGSYGRAFRQPIASNDTHEGRQLNRRTEIKILRMK
jgi:OOP family OmpA-OmpF porin